MFNKSVLVLSGKGGVGKTLIACNIALRLKEAGMNAGLLDADFSASNTGFFLGIEPAYMNTDGERFHPVKYEGIELFSIPMVFGEKSISMDGSQYSQLVRDSILETDWESDYLIVDCPAGFGDELKMAAKVLQDSIVGSVIVLQPAHELDAHRAIKLHLDLGMPILGLVENMSYFIEGDTEYKIFGESVVDSLGEQYSIPVFGKIPLSMEIRKNIEKHVPLIPDELSEPIKNAVSSILRARPSKPGFLARAKQWAQGQVQKVLLEFALSVNKELSIPDIQDKYGYPGGSIIRMNIMDEVMENIIYQVDWLVTAGRLTVVEADYDYSVDAQIDITPNALKWTLLGNKKTTNGNTYNFEDAMRLGHMRVYGSRSMARGAYFMRNVFNETMMNRTAMDKLRPLLELL